MPKIAASTLALFIGMAALSSGQAARDSTTLGLPLHLAGAAVSAAGVGNPTGAGRVEITVTRVSTDQERQQLRDVLASQGQDALLDELQDARPVGTIRFGTQLAYDLRYARQTAGEDGGVRLFLATDRPMTAWEVWNAPRYSQYPFTLINVEIDRNGRGTGTMLLAARVTADDDGRFINVENFASEPVRLNDLRITRD